MSINADLVTFFEELFSLINVDNRKNNIQVWFKHNDVLSVDNRNLKIAESSKPYFDCLKLGNDVKGIKKIVDDLNKLSIVKKFKLFYLLRGDGQYQIIFYKYDNLDYFARFVVGNFSKIDDFRHETFIINGARFNELKESKFYNEEILNNIKINSIGYVAPNLKNSEKKDEKKANISIASALPSPSVDTTSNLQNSWSSKLFNGSPIQKNTIVKGERSSDIEKDDDDDEDEDVVKVKVVKEEKKPKKISLRCRIEEKLEPVSIINGKFCIKKIPIDDLEINRQRMIDFVKEIYPTLANHVDLDSKTCL